MMLSFLKSSVFKFCQFEERLGKAPFLRWVSVDGRSNHMSNKVVFSNFSGIVWMGH